jgi:hypothetical protein
MPARHSPAAWRWCHPPGLEIGVPGRDGPPRAGVHRRAVLFESRVGAAAPRAARLAAQPRDSRPPATVISPRVSPPTARGAPGGVPAHTPSRLAPLLLFYADPRERASVRDDSQKAPSACGLALPQYGLPAAFHSDAEGRDRGSSRILASVTTRIPIPGAPPSTTAVTTPLSRTIRLAT